jgi:NADH-quinone oxidoreductase subunit G
VDIGTVWGSTVPATPGRSGDEIVAAALAGELGALLVGGVDLADLPDPAAARRAVEQVPFVVSLELRESPVTELADVVLPVAATAEKAGGFVNWEGRYRGFGKALRDSFALSDARVLAGIADEMGVDLGLRTVEQALAELRDVGIWDGARVELDPAGPATAPGASAPVATSEGAAAVLRLATWKPMLGDGRMLEGDVYLKATARPAVALVSPATLETLGLPVGTMVTLAPASATQSSGTVTLPVGVADLPDGVVWAPTSAAWSAGSGEPVRVTAYDSEGVH